MWATLTPLIFLCLVAQTLTQGRSCPSHLGSPRKHVVCYYSGRRAASTMDACLCTHLIYTSVGINEAGGLHLTKDMLSDLDTFRNQNPKLKVVISLGGAAVSRESFSTLITDKDRLDNLTSSINANYRDNKIHGIEIDWEWPIKDGGKKDRIKLIRYARQIKIAVGEEVIARRPRVKSIEKRQAEELTTEG